MAERRAMASGLSLSENETGGGGCGTSSGGPWRYASLPEARSVEVKRGVIGEYGGAAGVGGLSPWWALVVG